MSIEEKLQSVFPQSFQVKRVFKQINQIIQNKDKYYYEPKMSYTRGQCVVFTIEFLKNAFKKYKKLQNLTNFEVRIILKKEYPAKAPLIYCLSNTMIQFELEPFRDYSEFLTVDWSAKFTVLDIIRVFLDFVDRWNTGQERQNKGTYKVNQYFDVDRIFSWSFLQNFPVKFMHPSNKITVGLFIINCQSQVILLEQSQLRQSYITKDLIKINEIVSIFRSRQHNSQILLEIKKRENPVKQSLIFKSDDRQNIVNFIIEYMKIASTMGNGTQNNLDQESSDEEESAQFQEVKESPSKANIEEIKEQIVLYESLVQSNMNSENVSNLVILLKKAIQYYSAIGQSDYQIYLQKLKTLMSNEMAQILIQSAEQDKKKGNGQSSSSENNKLAFHSIIDMI